MKKCFVWLVSFALSVTLSMGLASHAFAGAKDNFCRVAPYFKGDNDLIVPLGWTTFALQQINGTLAVLSSLNLHYRVTKMKDSTHTLKQTLEIFKLWKQTKLFASTMIPPLDKLEKVFDAVKTAPLRALRKEPLDLTRINVRRLYTIMLPVSVSAGILKIASVSACTKATNSDQVCTRNNKSCAVQKDVTPVVRSEFDNVMPTYVYTTPGACALSDADKIAKFIELSNKYSNTLASMDGSVKNLSAVIWAVGPTMKTLGNNMSNLEAVARKIDSGLSVIENAMQPLFYVSSQLEKALEQQICVKIKVAGVGDKKCFRVRKLLEEVEKLNKFSKPFEKKLEDLLNPLFNQLKRAIPTPNIPGVDQIDSLMTGLTTDITNLDRKLAAFSSNPFASFATTMQQIDLELGTIQ